MYLLPIAALAMASCSSSDEVAQSVQSPAENQELKFFPAIEGSTRGAIETTSSISQFYVLASGDLKEGAAESSADYTSAWQAVTKNGANWNVTTKMYWAGDNATATFTAFANATKEDGTEFDATDLTTPVTSLANVTIPTVLDKQKDLVVAYNTGSRTAFASGVPLHFRHALSQIVVNATYVNDNTVNATTYPELVVKVKGVKFMNVKNKGTLTLPSASTASGNAYTPAWASVTGSETYATAPYTEITLSSAPQFIDKSENGANPLLLMPQTTAAAADLTAAPITGAYLMVEVDINKKSDNSDFYPVDGYTGNGNTGYAWIAVPVSIDWKGGYKYTYTLNFTNTAVGNVDPDDPDNPGEPIIEDVLTPVNFIVTVESEWLNGGSTISPAL